MIDKLTPESKVVIMAVAIVGAFVVGPIVTGIIVLMTIGVSQAPWPAIMLAVSTLVIGASWLILYKSQNSVALAITDLITLFILIMVSAIGSGRWESILFVYSVDLLLVILHSILALFTALGIVAQPAKEMLKASN
jgi:hypothetical protein